MSAYCIKLFGLVTIIASPCVLAPLNAQEQPDSIPAFKSALGAYPYAYYTPETQFAVGVGGFFTFYTQKAKGLNPSKVTLSTFYSTIETFNVSLSSDLFFARNRIASTISLFFGHTVDRFYGVGNNTPDHGDEDFVMESISAMLDFQAPPVVFISDRSGFIAEYGDYAIADKRENKYLENDSIPGSTGGSIAGMGLVWVWDTRDQIFFPNHGGKTEARAIFYSEDLGSDFTFTRVQVDARRYWAFSPDHVLATQLLLEAVGGNPPFFKLPALGGSNSMRGYFHGRYRDTTYLCLQMEYRQYVWRRLGFAAFVGFGDVNSDITRFTLRNTKPSYRAGLRLLFNEKQKINLRADVGLGKDTNGIYFSLEEAF